MNVGQKQMLSDIGEIIRIAVESGIEAERERCAKIAEYQSKIPDYTEVQRAHIYCAASIAAAIRKDKP